MKNLIKKITSILFASITLGLTIWYATLAYRGHCSWGLNGFAGYTAITYGFMLVVYQFLEDAIDQFSETTTYTENLDID